MKEESSEQLDREEKMKRMEIAMDHENARTRRKKWCEVCGTAVTKDHSTKFAAAGGVLAGPFCSPGCYWRFLGVSEPEDAPDPGPNQQLTEVA